MIFHPLHTDIPKPEKLNNPFFYTPHALCCLAADMVKAEVMRRKEWLQEVEKGKMFGVLVVERSTKNGAELGYLAAYSGQIAGRSDWEGFVPAVFDYLQTDGYFKTHEQKITRMNEEVDRLENNNDRRQLEERLQAHERQAKRDIEAWKEEIKRAKRQRDERRKAGANLAEEDAMIAESQFMKAELHRMKNRFKEERNAIEQQLKDLNSEIAALKKERRERSDKLQRWLFERFVMLNARGERRSLLDIFAHEAHQLPPAGTGECCAPKLLQYAFAHNMQPVCMAEFWIGRSPKNEVRREGCFYPACQGKCRHTLNFMLQGLDIDSGSPESTTSETLKTIYEDSSIVVVSKPAGMLSVNGKSGATSVESIMRKRYPNCSSPLIVHRLDMDTSGLILIAKTKEVHKKLQEAFRKREVKKRYVALLEGVLPADKQSGEISLPLSPDFNDRPRQIVNHLNGKAAITRYEVIGEISCHTLVALYPLTGRTHQLRVHCAHADGLNMPILGDPLYGTKANRLYLHAEQIAFSKSLIDTDNADNDTEHNAERNTENIITFKEEAAFKEEIEFEEEVEFKE